MREISGKQLYEAFASGGNAVMAERELLNRINVFPIPDGDTGSNLWYTLQHAIENSKAEESAGETMQSLAEKALLGARGNSGILFAQFVSGMAEIAGSEFLLSIETFSSCARHAVLQAYKAVSRPVEGTMLTVMKEWADALHRKIAQQERKTFPELIAFSLDAAQNSLQQTKYAIQSLRKADVVDAGAKGFVTFLCGFLEFLTHGKRAEGAHLGSLPPLELVEGHEAADLSLRYCTEGIVRGENLEQEHIRQTLADLGGDLIVAGSPKAMRVHIHTSDPAKVFERLGKISELGSQKVDDMLRQYQLVHQRKRPVAVVVDSSCDLPEAYLDEQQIYQVPMFISFGDTTYIDRVTIKEEQFYPMLQDLLQNPLQSASAFPKTSQPNISSFIRLYDQLKGHYDSVLAIHISEKLSATYQTSLQAAKKVGAPNIHVVEAKELAVGLGLIVMEAVTDLDAHKSVEEVKALIQANKRGLTSYVLTPSLDSFIRGGRLSPMLGLVGKLLNLKLVLSVDPAGKPYGRFKAFSLRQARNKVLADIAKKHREKRVRHFAVAHAQAPQEAAALAQKVSDITGIEPAYITEVSPVIGAHSGVGCTTVAVLQ